MPEKNTLAYFASSSVMKKKSLITLNYVINVVKHFFFVTDDETESDGVLAPGEHFYLACLIFAGVTGAYP